MKIKPTYVYLAVAVSLLLGGFYWYEYRPSKIRQECALLVTERSRLYDDIDDPAKWIETWTAVCIAAGGTEPFEKSIKSGDSEAAKRKLAAGAKKADHSNQ